MEMNKKTDPKEASYFISEDLKNLFKKYKERDPDFASEIMEVRKFYLEKSKK